LFALSDKQQGAKLALWQALGQGEVEVRPIQALRGVPDPPTFGRENEENLRVAAFTGPILN
jgi:hypothetical protein